MRRLPGSSRARWAAAGVAFALAVAVGITLRVRWLRQVGFPREIASQVQMSLKVTRADVDAWAGGYEAQASLLARIAAESPAFAGGVDASAGRPRAIRRLTPDEAAARFAASFGPVLRAVAASGTVEGCWVWDDRGALLGGTSSSAPERPSRALRTVSTARGVAVDFVAPVIVDGVRRGTLALRVAPTDSAFPNLNTMGRVSSAGRTSLLATVGDTIVVAASRRVGGTPLASRRFVAGALPAFVRAALDGRDSTGVGRSFSMRDAAYSATPVRSLGWVAVREFDADVIRSLVAPQIIVEETIFAICAALIIAVAFALLRASRLRRAGALARVRADFVSGVSHELRTPLAQIRMFAELLRKDALPEPGEADRALRIIEKEAGRLSILVDNVLNYARLQRQERPEPTRPADVAEEVRQVIEAFAPLAAERGVRIETDVAAGVCAAADAQALRQVLVNLLENAVKYGPRGQTVTIGARGDGARVRLWVDDQGPGIPAAERGTVFTAFHRGADAARSDAPGSGLGLAVVRSLVEHHGGAVSAEAAPSGGARMVVALPRAAGG